MGFKREKKLRLTLTTSLDPVSEAESQTLMNTTFLSFFDSLTNILSTPDSDVINNLDTFDFNNFVESLTVIASAITVR